MRAATLPVLLALLPAAAAGGVWFTTEDGSASQGAETPVSPAEQVPMSWLLDRGDRSPMAPVAAPQERDEAGWPGGPPPREFYFTRGIYSDHGWRRRQAWATDFPKAEEQFLTVLTRLTGVDAHPGANPVRLDDPGLRRFPILYMVEVGYMALSPPERQGLRDYLLAGGTLVVDDFWGSAEWANFHREIREVLPEYPVVPLPMDHPLFSTYYQVDSILQVPAFRGAATAWLPTHERDGYVAEARGIFDDTGRLMVVINWNTDLGDAWEWMEQPAYPLRLSTFAYQMGVNFIIHSMSR